MYWFCLQDLSSTRKIRHIELPRTFQTRKIRRPSVGVLEPSWGRGLPLPYPSPPGGHLQDVRKTIVKHEGFHKIQVLFERRGGVLNLMRNRIRPPESRKIQQNQFPEHRKHVKYDKISSPEHRKHVQYGKLRVNRNVCAPRSHVNQRSRLLGTSGRGRNSTWLIWLTFY